MSEDFFFLFLGVAGILLIFLGIAIIGFQVIQGTLILLGGVFCLFVSLVYLKG